MPLQITDTLVQRALAVLRTAGILEFIGGLLLLLGLFARPVAFVRRRATAA